jgi:methionine synthase II (cobalamin-independent)
LEYIPNHRIYEFWNFLKDNTPEGIVPKIGLLTPTYAYFYGDDGDPFPSCYSNKDEFYADIVKAYSQTIIGIYDQGCRYVEIDEPT